MKILTLYSSVSSADFDSDVIGLEFEFNNGRRPGLH